jgi:hypothetical protein
MASTDKALDNLSAWISLAALAGLVAIRLFFAHEDVPPPHQRAKPPLAANAPAQSAPSPSRSVQTPPSANAPAAAAPGTTSPPNAPSAAAPGATAPPASATAPDVWTDAEQVAGLRDCLRLLAPLALEIDVDVPIRHGQCGTPAPLLLHSVGEADKVVFDPAPEMNCRLAASVARWVETVLQPLAKEVLKSPVVKIIGASSYACRNVYNSPNLPLSEHATGNAVDVVGFVTAEGRTITVKDWWGPTERAIVQVKKKAVETAAKATLKRHPNSKADGADPPIVANAGTTGEDAAKKAAAANERFNRRRAGLKSVPGANAATIPPPAVVASTTTEATFLKRLHHGACSVFTTVLGPEANEAHRDHFHLDMKDRKGAAGICH